MPLSFEWDETKAKSNLAKHGVSFEGATRASTVFGDPLSLTIPDPAHSQRERRAIVLGHSHERKLLVVVHTERGIIFALSAPGAQAGVKRRAMKKATDSAAEPEMRAEY